MADTGPSDPIPSMLPSSGSSTDCSTSAASRGAAALVASPIPPHDRRSPIDGNWDYGIDSSAGASLSPTS
ncbi:unnamed protein product [Urochloa humidicola]